ncbi:Protein of unknown function [Gryllus bimaculatus]|nr:Protein of unknown function [Gryllus bimaculatus]
MFATHNTLRLVTGAKMADKKEVVLGLPENTGRGASLRVGGRRAARSGAVGGLAGLGWAARRGAAQRRGARGSVAVPGAAGRAAEAFRFNNVRSLCRSLSRKFVVGVRGALMSVVWLRGKWCECRNKNGEFTYTD